MCLRTSNVATDDGPNWDGDRIESDPIVPSGRFVAGTHHSYPIDVREFVSNPSNAVVRRELEAVGDNLASPEARSLFYSRRAGAFDHRVRAICAHLSTKTHYLRSARRGADQWLFADESIAQGGGDCEDLAILLASMLLASGVSGYVVRVALGRLVDQTTGNSVDHAWVVYKSESGHWLLLDPLLYTFAARAERAEAVRASRGGVTTATHAYVPHFVFNDAHLWAVKTTSQSGSLRDYLDRRTFWSHFDPTFAASVHNSIFDEALAAMPWVDRQFVKAVSLAVDANLATYDPRDHFDNAFIDDSWAVVDTRLASRSLSDFALACHAIGDFYAHSSWGVFGERKDGKLAPLLTPKSPRFDVTPDYSEDGRFPFQDGRFSVNATLWGPKPRSVAVDGFAGKLVSGRYAQSGDASQGAAERVTYIPSELASRPDYALRGGLPHHNEIAVDSPSRGSDHKLYAKGAYEGAFNDRLQAAVVHVKHVYATWSGRS